MPLTTTRYRAPSSYLDDRDQKIRYPGDTGLAFIGKYVVSKPSSGARRVNGRPSGNSPRAHVRARSLCSEFVVDWLRSRGVEVGVDPREQLSFLAEGRHAVCDRVDWRAARRRRDLAALARDGDVAVVTLPNGEQRLASCDLAASSRRMGTSRSIRKAS